MSVSRLLFPLDKNYILKEAQADTQNELLANLVAVIKETYLTLFNPLDLEDDTIKEIKNCKLFELIKNINCC